MLLATLGTVAALAVTGARADPPADGRPVTVFRTVTEDRAYQGRGVRWWAARATQNARERNAARGTAETLGRRVRELQRAARVRATSGLHGLVDAFLCIHRYEGSWGAATGNGYYGGLQMDKTFQLQYGSWAVHRWGYANNWSPDVQVVVALTAYLSGRGFYPWPNTARYCGLL